MSPIKKTLVMSAAAGVIAAVLLAGSAQAADVAPAAAPAEPGADAVDEIVVQGFRKSLGAARLAKKDSAIVADVIVAEDMAKFPDLNLAESLQRLPGRGHQP
jgi:iron complex outermembrane receptor protein